MPRISQLVMIVDTCLVLVAATAAAVAARATTGWSIGDASALRVAVALNGSDSGRLVATLCAVAVAASAVMALAFAALRRPPRVSLWLGHRATFTAPASTVAAYLQTMVAEVGGVRSVRVRLRNARSRTAPLEVELAVEAGSDLSAVAAAVSTRLSTALTVAGIVLLERPAIVIRSGATGAPQGIEREAA